MPEASDPASPRTAAGALSPAALRYRDLLRLPISVLPTRPSGVALAEYSARLAAAIHEWAGKGQTGPSDLRLWDRDELPGLAELPAPDLAREWRRRLDASDAWASARVALRVADPADAWTALAQGDFGALGRGVDYTDGISRFHAARCAGSEALLRLLGVGSSGDDGGGLFLDVLGGDGYLWRVQRGTASLTGRGAAARLITNDRSRHMFMEAGAWGLASLEDATVLDRTFASASVDGVLFAYGTHHIEDMERAVAAAAGVLKPGGTVVLHDFFDEDPVGSWFHEVVEPFSKTGHDLPHIGPLLMAVLLLTAGLRRVELYEMSDPFVFTAAHRPARDLALDYLGGMYGLSDGAAGAPEVLESLVRRHLTYPELDDEPRFRPDWSYVPRRAVVARGHRAAAGAPLTAGDAGLAATLVELLEHPDGVSGVPPDVARWWHDGGRLWGVGEGLRRRFLAWSETAGVSP